MRPVFLILTALSLAACEAPCDPDEAVCNGELRWGMAAFAANPADLDGLYSPQLAGCMVTRWSPDGEVESVRQYDEIGRLLLDSSGLPQDTYHQRTLVWEEGCPVQDHTVSGDCSVLTEQTCDDEGWPVTTRTSFVDSDGATSAILSATIQRTYRDHELVASERWEIEDGGKLALSERTEVDWASGRPRAQRFYQGDSAQPSYRIDWTWGPQVLERQVGTSSFGPREVRVLEYTQDDLLQAEAVGDARVTWLREPGQHWPYLEVDAEGRGYGVEYACDTP